MPMRSVERGRAAFDRGELSEAYECLRAAAADSPLEPEDLDRLATAAHLVGDDAAAVDARVRAHNAFLERGDTRRAARSAFWLGFTMIDRPATTAQASGWLARAQRLVDELDEPCAERGWLLCTSARQQIVEGNLEAAHAAFREAARIGTSCGDRDLVEFARHGEGRTLLALKRTPEALAILDEVMLAVTAGEIAPMVAGVIYCSVISACNDLFDIRRAHEWTTALQEWCACQAETLPFRGECMVRRAELMQFHGDWSEAMTEVRLASGRMKDFAAGAAYYQLGELHRLRGDFDAADEAYRLASQAGKQPVPGLPLLRLAQGQAAAAEASIRAALQLARAPRMRILLLSAAVEIMLARDNLDEARSACDELTELSGRIGSQLPRALASRARGALAVAEVQPLVALELLQEAAAIWNELDAPYELARTRVLIGEAHRQLGDEEGARLELDAAHDIFERLGALTDAADVARRSGEPAAADGGLTGREVEVLRLIATGVTNRTIATRLGISEKTVARHVSNIFTKLDLPSRAAATAYAYDHKLV